MNLNNKQRYLDALIVSFLTHIVAFVLLIFVCLFVLSADYDVIEVTLSEGSNVNLEQQTDTEDSKQEIEQQEEETIPEVEKEFDEITDTQLPPEPVKPKQDEHVKEVSHKKEASKQGDGGTDEYTSMPKILHMVKPDYPPAARNMDKQGKVFVKLLIAKNGTVKQAEIVRSGGFAALDEAVLKAVYKWQFLPAKNKYGRSSACSVVVPIKFELKDAK